MKKLNLGCGQRFHPDWENVDLSPARPIVHQHDLRKGVPYPDQTFDAVYHSHVLEHFPRRLAPMFIGECYRVLKPGGVMRVAVPDLEQITRAYLDALEKARQGLDGWERNHEWMILEMYDQTVRTQTGGECAEYFRQEPFPNWDFVHQRVGAEADAALEYFGRKSDANQGRPPKFASKLDFIFRHAGQVARNKFAKTFLSREDYEALQEGRFRKQGEVHHWMYDADSLAQLLREAGLQNPVRRRAGESAIRNWTEFHLDTDADGNAYKPDSLFMEAMKP